MFRRAAGALGVGSGSARDVQDAAPPCEEALLKRWMAQGGLSPAALAAFSGTSELPAGPEPAAVRGLLLRYLRAEKLDLGKAAARLEAQAAWRQGFGSVAEVRCTSQSALELPCMRMCRPVFAHPCLPTLAHPPAGGRGVRAGQRQGQGAAAQRHQLLAPAAGAQGVAPPRGRHPAAVQPLRGLLPGGGVGLLLAPGQPRRQVGGRYGSRR